VTASCAGSRSAGSPARWRRPGKLWPRPLTTRPQVYGRGRSGRPPRHPRRSRRRRHRRWGKTARRPGQPEFLRQARLVADVEGIGEKLSRIQTVETRSAADRETAVGRLSEADPVGVAGPTRRSRAHPADRQGLRRRRTQGRGAGNRETQRREGGGVSSNAFQLLCGGSLCGRS